MPSFHWQAPVQLSGQRKRRVYTAISVAAFERAVTVRQAMSGINKQSDSLSECFTTALSSRQSVASGRKFLNSKLEVPYRLRRAVLAGGMSNTGQIPAVARNVLSAVLPTRARSINRLP